MKMIRFFTAAVFASGVISATGCSSIAERLVKEPKVALSSIGLKDATSEGATLLVGVEVDNPNSFALEVDSVRYELELGGRQVGTGEIKDPMKVEAGKKGVVTIPVPVKFANIYSSVLDLFANKPTAYRVKGDASFGLLTIPFDKVGELKLKP